MKPHASKPSARKRAAHYQQVRPAKEEPAPLPAWMLDPSKLPKKPPGKP